MLLPTDCQRLDILQQPGVRSCFLEGAQPGRSADLRTIGMRSSSRPYDLAAHEFADDDLAGLSGRINASHHCGTGAHFPSCLAQYRDLLGSRFWPVQPNCTTLPQPDSKRSKVSWRTRNQTPARCHCTLVEPPTGRVSKSLPELNASGGQVIGSIANPIRLVAGSGRSAVWTWSHGQSLPYRMATPSPAASVSRAVNMPSESAEKWVKA